MNGSTDALELGRAAYGRQAWGEAFAQLSSADRSSSPEPADLDLLAVAADLIGRDEDCDEFRTRAHQGYLRRSEVAQAARAAFWLGMSLINRGEMARGGGWLTRARRVLDESGVDCVEQGYVLAPLALQSMDEGDLATAYATFEQAGTIADRFGDPDLMTLSRLGRGQTLILQ